MSVPSRSLRVAKSSEELTFVQRLKLGWEILGSYVHVRRLLWRRKDLPSVLALLREPPRQLRRPPEGNVLRSGLRLGSAVGKALNVIPADSRCLVRSLVLTRILTVRGIESVFVIGVNADPHDFGAHAWVEHDGVPLLPPSDFQRLAEL
jgi:Transglutaminase-like superfamily